MICIEKKNKLLTGFIYLASIKNGSDCVVIILFQSSCPNLWQDLQCIYDKAVAGNITRLARNSLCYSSHFHLNCTFHDFNGVVSSRLVAT